MALPLADVSTRDSGAPSFSLLEEADADEFGGLLNFLVPSSPSNRYAMNSIPINAVKRTTRMQANPNLLLDIIDLLLLLLLLSLCFADGAWDG